MANVCGVGQVPERSIGPVLKHRAVAARNRLNPRNFNEKQPRTTRTERNHNRFAMAQMSAHMMAPASLPGHEGLTRNAMECAMADDAVTLECREYKDYAAYLLGEHGVVPTGTVYFIGPESGPIKIGYTNNLAERLRGLQTGNPVDLIVFASMPGTLACERSWHRSLERDRIRGEWFELTDRVRGAIRSAHDWTSGKTIKVFAPRDDT